MPVSRSDDRVQLSIMPRRTILALPFALWSVAGGHGFAAASIVFASPEAARPDYIRELEVNFGLPNRNGFGSTVLFAIAEDRNDLEGIARGAYRFFVGDLWDRRGEAAWMGTWKLVHERTSTRDILAELSNLDTPQYRSSADMLINVAENPEAGKAALTVAFDDPSILDMLVYGIGDGGAMSGLLIAARRSDGEATLLVFLMD
jgi:hypothetical protein